jgi:predicted metal-dependent phosphoesterase TrpH
MLIDLHNHTWPRSHDSVLDPADLIVRAKAAGLDGICLTEHDAVWPEEEARALAEEHEYLVIPGIEVSTDDGHILAWGVEKYVFGMHRAERLATHVAERGGCLVAAHPYRRQVPWKDDEEQWRQYLEKAARNPSYKHCIALEVLNGRGNARENRFSQDLQAQMGLPGTAGTDSHAVHDIGKVATYFESDAIETWQDLVQELQAGRFCAVDMESGQEYAVPAGKDYAPGIRRAVGG